MLGSNYFTSVPVVIMAENYVNPNWTLLFQIHEHSETQNSKIKMHVRVKLQNSKVKISKSKWRIVVKSDLKISTVNAQ